MKALGPETPKKLTLYFSRNNSSKFANLLFTVTFWSTTTANNENGLYLVYLPSQKDSPGGSNSKASAYNAGDPVSIPGWGRCPVEGNGNPLQYSCLENPRDGGDW